MPKFLLIFLLALSACASAPTATVDSVATPPVLVPTEAKARAPYFLTLESLPADLLPPPPAVGSAVDRDDLKILEQWQKNRTPKLCAEMMSQKNITPQALFPDYPFKEGEAADLFFNRVLKDTTTAVDVYKKKFLRARPFLRTDAKIKACYEETRGTSYPSGHATIAELYGRIMMKVDPAHKEAYQAAADQAALYRVIGGVHHPSDIRAGKALGDALFDQFSASKQFEKDLSALPLKH